MLFDVAAVLYTLACCCDYAANIEYMYLHIATNCCLRCIAPSSGASARKTTLQGRRRTELFTPCNPSSCSDLIETLCSCFLTLQGYFCCKCEFSRLNFLLKVTSSFQKNLLQSVFEIRSFDFSGNSLSGILQLFELISGKSVGIFQKIFLEVIRRKNSWFYYCKSYLFEQFYFLHFLFI